MLIQVQLLLLLRGNIGFLASTDWRRRSPWAMASTSNSETSNPSRSNSEASGTEQDVSTLHSSHQGTSQSGNKRQSSDSQDHRPKIPRIENVESESSSMSTDESLKQLEAELELLRGLTAEKYLNLLKENAKYYKDAEIAKQTLLSKDNDIKTKEDLLKKERDKNNNYLRALFSYQCPGCSLFYLPPDRIPLMLICHDHLCHVCLPKKIREVTTKSNEKKKVIVCPSCNNTSPQNTEKVNTPMINFLRIIYNSINLNNVQTN